MFKRRTIVLGVGGNLKFKKILIIAQVMPILAPKFCENIKFLPLIFMKNMQKIDFIEKYSNYMTYNDLL